MSYERTILRAWEHHRLFSALVELTYRCNLDCHFCYNDLTKTGKALGFSDYDRLFEDLAGLGCLHLALSGGEPLAHPDFFAIGARARELGFALRIKSNGHALGRAVARRLKREVDPWVVELSLHGARPETHDRQTRVPGSFERLMNHVTAMRDEGLRLKLNTTLTRWNEAEVEGLFAIAERFDLPLTIDPEVTPRDDGDPSPLDISPSAEGLRRLVKAQRRQAGSRGVELMREGDTVTARASGEASKMHCGAGSGGIAVDPYGDVFPCVQWRRPIGNLHERRLTEIWTGNDELEAIRRLTVAAKAKLDAAQEKVTGFCPGVAEMLTGNPLEIPEATARRSRALSELPLHPVS